MRDNEQSAHDWLDDHEARIRALEQTSARLLGALIFIAAEIPIVMGLATLVLQHLTKP